MVVVSNPQAEQQREARLLREAMSDSARLRAADQAMKEGDLNTASLLYTRLAVSRNRSEATLAARQRLQHLEEQGRIKLAELDGQLPDQSAIPTTDDLLQAASGDQAAVAWRKQVMEVFDKYEELERQYERVPNIGREIKRHVVQQRLRLNYAAVIEEPQARELYELAQKYETEDNLCCAYLVYDRASRLAPVPSAQLAHDRLARLNAQPEVSAAVQLCRTMQWCHETFVRAEMLAKVRPEKAKELFAEILTRAPADSEVYQEARRQVHAL